MSELQQFFDRHKPKSTPGVIDLALKETHEGTGVAIDLCCGSGALAARVSQRGFQAYGVDISARYIDPCRTWGFVVADVGATLPFRSGCARLVYCIDSLQYFSDPEGLLVEIARLLEAGGVLILSTQNNYNLTGIKRSIIERITRKTWSPWLAHPIENHMTFPWLVRALKRQGFEIDYIRGLQFLTAWTSLLPAALRHWSPWKDKPWRSLASIAQRTPLPASLEESVLARFAMIVFIRAHKAD